MIYSLELLLHNGFDIGKVVMRRVYVLACIKAVDDNELNRVAECVNIRGEREVSHHLEYVNKMKDP